MVNLFSLNIFDRWSSFKIFSLTVHILTELKTWIIRTKNYDSWNTSIHVAQPQLYYYKNNYQKVSRKQENLFRNKENQQKNSYLAVP